MFISTQIGLNVYIFFLFFYRFNEAGFVCRYIRLHGTDFKLGDLTKA